MKNATGGSDVHHHTENMKTSNEIGEASEQLFRSSVEVRGHTVNSSSRRENMYEHIDFYVLLKTGETITVDVKAAKSTNRGGPVDYTVILLEHLNVRGDAGWIHGKATHVAFEMEEYFLLVNRGELLALAMKVDWEHSTPKPYAPVMYKAYDRSKFGKLDKFCYVPAGAVESIQYAVHIPKRGS
jgi:hypothetical protein